MSPQTTHRYHFISREDVVLTDGQPTNSDDEDNGMFDTVKNIYGVFDDSRFKNTSYTMTVYNQTNVEGLSQIWNECKDGYYCASVKHYRNRILLSESTQPWQIPTLMMRQ